MKRRGRLDGWVCGRGHASLYAQEACPRCGDSLASRPLGTDARLETCTTVRVNPGGEPYRLGVAVTTEGASTLCVVEGAVRGNGRDRVRLVRRGEVYVALGKGWRITADSSARSATSEGSRKS